MKIIINENQLRLINEDLAGQIQVSYEMRESIALWCLTNDFRYYNPDRLIGRGTSVANDGETNKEICLIIMKASSIERANDEKELFGYYDYDDATEGDDEREEFTNGYNIYKVNYDNTYLLIEVLDSIGEYDAEFKMQDYLDGENDEELVGWFNRIFR